MADPRKILRMARIPGLLGSEHGAGRVVAGAGRSIVTRVVEEIGEKAMRLALKKAGSRIVGKILTGSRYWEKAFEHIPEHFSKAALAQKMVHTVFVPKYRTKEVLEGLVRRCASKPGRRILTKMTVHGNPLGRPVVILEREFQEVIGEEFRQGVEAGTPCKILRVIIDYTGRPVTAYPVKEFFGS